MTMANTRMLLTTLLISCVILAQGGNALDSRQADVETFIKSNWGNENNNGSIRGGRSNANTNDLSSPLLNQRRVQDEDEDEEDNASPEDVVDGGGEEAVTESIDELVDMVAELEEMEDENNDPDDEDEDYMNGLEDAVGSGEDAVSESVEDLVEAVEELEEMEEMAEEFGLVLSTGPTDSAEAEEIIDSVAELVDAVEELVEGGNDTSVQEVLASALGEGTTSPTDSAGAEDMIESVEDLVGAVEGLIEGNQTDTSSTPSVINEPAEGETNYPEGGGDDNDQGGNDDNDIDFSSTLPPTEDELSPTDVSNEEGGQNSQGDGLTFEGTSAPSPTGEAVETDTPTPAPSPTGEAAKTDTPTPAPSLTGEAVETDTPTPAPSEGEVEDWQSSPWGDPVYRGPTDKPTGRPTIEYIPMEGPYDPLAEEKQADKKDFNDDEIFYHGLGDKLGGTVGDYLDGVESPQEMEKDKNVQVIAGILGSLFLILLLVTAHLVMNHPDGLCAG